MKQNYKANCKINKIIGILLPERINPVKNIIKRIGVRYLDNFFE